MKKRCEYCGGSRRDLEFRGVLSLVLIALTFGFAYYQIYSGGDGVVPPWMVGLTSGVVSTYIMSRSGEIMRKMTREKIEGTGKNELDKTVL